MKKIEIKPLLLSLGLVIFQSSLYALSKLLQSSPTLIGNVIDSKIPFNIYFIIPYAIWYLMLFIIPYIYYKKDKKLFTKYFLSYIFMTVIANIIFVAFPTTVNRPEVTGTNIIELLTRLIFWVDTPILNCFPSLHCAIAFAWILFTTTSKNINTKTKIITSIISLTIIYSTLAVKQHVVIDAISGILLASIVFLYLYFESKLTDKTKKILKI